MTSGSPFDWTLQPSRLQFAVTMIAAVLGLSALLLLTELPPWVIASLLLIVLGLEAWRFWRSGKTHLGRYVIRADGYWQLPGSEALWQLKAVSWFPGLCQCRLVETMRPGISRHVMFWRDQVDADSWRRLRARLMTQSP